MPDLSIRLHRRSPPSLIYRGEKTSLFIGDQNIIREFVTLHRGTIKGGGKTVIGNENFFMAYSHVAHDCQIGNQVVMANGATLAGHILIEDHAIIGGLSAIHQFCQVGTHAFISGLTGVSLGHPSLYVGFRKSGQALWAQHCGSQTPQFFRRDAEGSEEGLPHHFSLRSHIGESDEEG